MSVSAKADMLVHYLLIGILIHVGTVTPDKAEVIKTIKAALSCHNNPALTVAVVKDDKVELSEGFGTRRKDGQGGTVTDSTLFGIASLSKAFAATLIVKLLDETGRFRLDTPLREVFQNDHIFSQDLQSKYATIRDLLAHRIGMPGNNRIRLDQNLTRANLLNRLRHISIKGRFRDSFYYSNLMYGVLTHLAETLGGAKWEELIDAHLFQPLGMTSSTFATTAKPDDLDIAQAYAEKYGTLETVPWELTRRWGLLCGSGCVITNAKDMIKWMMFHLNKGNNSEGQRVVDVSAISQMYKPQLRLQSSNEVLQRPKTPVTRSYNNYAMGFRNGYYRGYKMLSHSGSTFGYKALLTLYPDMKLGIFTALTGDDPGYKFRTILHSYLSDLYLGEKPWLNQTTLCSFPEPFYKSSPKKTKPVIEKYRALARNMSQYTGVYHHEAYGNLKILPKFPLQMEYGYGEFKLYAKTTKDHFIMEAFGLTKLINFGTVIFRTQENNNGVIDRIELPGFQKDAPPVFYKVIATSDTCILSSYPTMYLFLSSIIAMLLHLS